MQQHVKLGVTSSRSGEMQQFSVHKRWQAFNQAREQFQTIQMLKSPYPIQNLLNCIAFAPGTATDTVAAIVPDNESGIASDIAFPDID